MILNQWHFTVDGATRSNDTEIESMTKTHINRKKIFIACWFILLHQYMMQYLQIGVKWRMSLSVTAWTVVKSTAFHSMTDGETAHCLLWKMLVKHGRVPTHYKERMFGGFKALCLLPGTLLSYEVSSAWKIKTSPLGFSLKKYLLKMAKEKGRGDERKSDERRELPLSLANITLCCK